MPVLIPIRASVPRQRFDVIIEGLTYTFRARWSTRSKLWFLTVLEAGGTPIVTGAAVTLGSAIGRTSNHALFMNGMLVARDSSKKDREAGLDDIGTRVTVRYMTRDELAQEVLGDATGGRPDPSIT